jgi:hypothetical protein
MLDTSHKDIILHFKGHLDYDVIGELIISLKEKMRQRRVRFGLYKRILTLMIESLENIIRYRTNVGNRGVLLDDYQPEFLIALDEDRVFIETANALFNPDINTLSERLIQLNNLDPDELKELYKETITNGKFSDKGGAGLGIIEMAKIADEKMEFDFKTVNDQVSMFYLKLIIKKVTLKDKTSN